MNGISKLCIALGISIGFCACETLPIRGKVCYTDRNGNQVCVGANKGVIELDAQFANQK